MSRTTLKFAAVVWATLLATAAIYFINAQPHRNRVPLPSTKSNSHDIDGQNILYFSPATTTQPERLVVEFQQRSKPNPPSDVPPTSRPSGPVALPPKPTTP